MNAIRRDEDLDNFHSIYVDQWDWEKIISKEERTEETLKATVETIFKTIKQIEKAVAKRYPGSVYHLADEIFFVTTQELEDRWPELTPEEREDKITKEKKAVFLIASRNYRKPTMPTQESRHLAISDNHPLSCFH